MVCSSIMGLITLMIFRQLISSEEGVEGTGSGEERGCGRAGDLAAGHDEVYWLSACLSAVTEGHDRCLQSFLPFFPLLPSCPFTPTHSVCHFPLPSSSSLWCFTGTDAGYWAPVLAGCPCSRAANQIAVPELFTQVHLHTGIYVCLSHTHTHTHTHENHTWGHLFVIHPKQLDTRNTPPHTIWSCSFFNHLVLTPSHHYCGLQHMSPQWETLKHWHTLSSVHNTTWMLWRWSMSLLCCWACEHISYDIMLCCMHRL